MCRFHLMFVGSVLSIAGCMSERIEDNVAKEARGDASALTLPAPKTEWSAFEDIGVSASPLKVTRGKFDRVHSGMTLGELTELLGRGWIRSQVEGCGVITWTCDDDRELQVWPTTYRAEEIIDAGPRQVGGTGGRGRMWMTKLREGREPQDLPIPAK